MINYIKADLRRILIRMPRLLLVLTCYLVLVAIIVHQYLDDWSAYNYCNTVQTYCMFAIPIVLGIIELSTVYADDFRAKTMQVAIGVGIPRPMVVLTKLIDFMVIMLVDIIGIAFITFVSAGILKAGLAAEQYGDLLIFFLDGILKAVSSVSVAMIPLFYLQSAGIGSLVYLLMSVPVIPLLISEALKIGPLVQFRLDRYLLYNQIDQLGAYILTGTVKLGLVAGIAVQLVILYIVTVLLFNKRELEF